jgi:hypothetical protein
MTCARGTAVPSAELKVTTPIRSFTRAAQALLRMALRVARVKLDCAGPVQWRGGKKQSTYYSDMSCSRIFCRWVSTEYSFIKGVSLRVFYWADELMLLLFYGTTPAISLVLTSGLYAP